MLGRKSEMRETRSVVGPAAAVEADGATDAAVDGGGATEAAVLADGDAVVPPHAAAIRVIAPRTAGNRAFIGLLLSQLPARAMPSHPATQLRLCQLITVVMNNGLVAESADGPAHA